MVPNLIYYILTYIHDDILSIFGIQLREEDLAVIKSFHFPFPSNWRDYYFPRLLFYAPRNIFTVILFFHLFRLWMYIYYKFFAVSEHSDFWVVIFLFTYIIVLVCTIGFIIYPK